MAWIAVGIGAALVAAVVYWRIHRRCRHRMIALVALLREPRSLDPAVLARLAGKAWDVGTNSGASLQERFSAEAVFVLGLGRHCLTYVTGVGRSGLPGGDLMRNSLLQAGG